MHIKDGSPVSTEPPRITIQRELEALEAAEGLGMRFVMLEQGMRLGTCFDATSSWLTHRCQSCDASRWSRWAGLRWAFLYRVGRCIALPGLPSVYGLQLAKNSIGVASEARHALRRPKESRNGDHHCC
jgi:hypothetical protein